MAGRSKTNGAVTGSGPPGNRKTLIHGVYGYLDHGQLPPGCDDIADDAGELRDKLLSDTLSRHGEVTITRADTVDGMITHYVIGRLLTRWLTKRRDELDIDKELTILRDIERAVDKRGARLRELDLDGGSVTDNVMFTLRGIQAKDVSSDTQSDESKAKTPDNEGT